MVVGLKNCNHLDDDWNSASSGTSTVMDMNSAADHNIHKEQQQLNALQSDHPHLYFGGYASPEQERLEMLPFAQRLCNAVDLPNIDLLFQGFEGQEVPFNRFQVRNHACLIFAVYRCEPAARQGLNEFLTEVEGLDKKERVAKLEAKSRGYFDEFIGSCKSFSCVHDVQLPNSYLSQFIVSTEPFLRPLKQRPFKKVQSQVNSQLPPWTYLL